MKVQSPHFIPENGRSRRLFPTPLPGAAASLREIVLNIVISAQIKSQSQIIVEEFGGAAGGLNESSKTK